MSVERPRFSLSYVDPSVDPLKDFYSYAVGGWLRTKSLPEDKVVWGAFNELAEYNFGLLRTILEEAASKRGGGLGVVERLVGDLYASGMDTERIEGVGVEPIMPLLSRLRGVGSRLDLVRLLGELHTLGVRPLFTSYSRADRKNSGVYSLYLYQGGLSLPDREYYLSPVFEGVRSRFAEHVSRMFRLIGLGEGEAERRGRVVLEVEGFLAKNSRARVDLRDPEKNYNRVEWGRLGLEYPALRLDLYLEAVRVPRVPFVVVGQPEYFKALDQEFSSRPLEEWMVYFEWHILHTFAQHLHSPLESEHFEFFHRVLLGQRKPEPRWKRVTRVVDSLMGEALGQLYVERHFPPEARRRVAVMIEDIKAALRDRIARCDWMGEETKRRALFKLDRLTYKIGHPEKFRDYSHVRIERGDYVGNIMRLNVFEARRQFDRVGAPVDRGEWNMTPPTVNAYYSPSNNEIVLPAGILQPPFFDVEMDDAVNYGGIGSVIGHELTHGFDDQGRRYDAEGNLTDWWTKEDEERFRERAERVVKLYSSIEVLPNTYLNGRLTLGENIADLGGVRVAFDALQRRLEAEPEKRRPIDGLTPEQRFFISYAQIWRQLIREEELRRRLTVDPHSPGRVRGSIPVVTHPHFRRVFGGEAALPQEDASVW